MPVELSARETQRLWNSAPVKLSANSAASWVFSSDCPRITLQLLCSGRLDHQEQVRHLTAFLGHRRGSRLRGRDAILELHA